MESLEYKACVHRIDSGTKFVRVIDEMVKLRKTVMKNACVIPYTGAVVVFYFLG